MFIFVRFSSEDDVAYEGGAEQEPISNGKVGEKGPKQQQKKKRKKKKKRQQIAAKTAAQVESVESEDTEVEYIQQIPTVNELEPMYRQFARIFEVFKLVEPENKAEDNDKGEAITQYPPVSSEYLKNSKININYLKIVFIFSIIF